MSNDKLAMAKIWLEDKQLSPNNFSDIVNEIENKVTSFSQGNNCNLIWNILEQLKETIQKDTKFTNLSEEKRKELEPAQAKILYLQYLLIKDPKKYIITDRDLQHTKDPLAYLLDSSKKICNPAILREIGVLLKEQGKYTKAIKFYEEAIKASDELAKVRLGFLYEKGLGFILPNREKAFKLYREAANKGLSDGKFQLAYCYENGIGVKKDISRAKYFYNEVAKAGYIDAKNRLTQIFNQEEQDPNYTKGVAFETSGDYVNAAKFYQKAIKDGHTQAKVKFANFYKTGQGLSAGERSTDKALRLYEQAAGEGSAEALEPIFKLAAFYKTVEDITKSKSIYKMLVEAAYQPAKSKLSEIDLEEKSLYTTAFTAENEARYEDARKSYLKAISFGNILAKVRLGYLFETAKGLKEANFSKAFELYKEAADQGCPEGMYHLAHCFEKGINVTNDFDQAKAFYELAGKNYKKKHTDNSYTNISNSSKEGNIYFHAISAENKGKYKDAIKYYLVVMREDKYPEAKVRLGNLCETGKGLEKPNLTKAFELYKEAADRDCPEGIYHTARCLENGIGVKMNIKEAKKLYELAGRSYQTDRTTPRSLIDDSNLSRRSSIIESLV